MTATKDKKEQKLGFLNLLVLILTIYVLVAMLFDTFLKLPPETSRILRIVDDLICVFFLLEFSIRFYQAENKLKFMKWGWIDIVSSIPAFSYFRAGRALRLIRLLRIVRTFRSTQHFVTHIFRNKAEGTFTAVAIISVLLIIFSSIGILQVETDPNSNIKTAEDALWWSYATITTVGYGDKFPVTSEGRLIGIVLMTAGVGLFGTFSGFVASWFLASHKKNNEKSDDEKEQS
jgi:voltage-gated potassium channel